MIIENVKIKGFRNIKEFDLDLSPGSNLIHGQNGAGKTSILESLFLLAFGKSFLNRKKKELLNYHSDQFIVKAVVTNSKLGENQVTGHFQQHLTLHLNEKKSNIFEINNVVYPVFFSSADYNLYIENKPHTRKMMDRFIFGVDALYIRYLLSYNNTLKQKNQLLKTTRNLTELRSWNKILSELAAKLVGIKMTFVRKLNQEIETKFGKQLQIQYKPSLDIEKGVEDSLFFEQIESMRERELHTCRAMAGPHLDGYALRLNKIPLNHYSSGEKKINLLMVYISFIELFKKIKSEYPVFLVDDFDTAIDAKNISFLIENYPSMQVIATSVNHNSRFHHLVELAKEN